MRECLQNGHAELYTSYSDHMLWGKLSINDKDRVVMWPSEAQDTALESLQAGSKRRFHWFCLSGTECRRSCSSWRPQHTIWQRHQQAPSRCSNCRSCRSLNQSFTRCRGERDKKKKKHWISVKKNWPWKLRGSIPPRTNLKWATLQFDSFIHDYIIAPCLWLVSTAWKIDERTRVCIALFITAVILWIHCYVNCV